MSVLRMTALAALLSGLLLHDAVSQEAPPAAGSAPGMQLTPVIHYRSTGSFSGTATYVLTVFNNDAPASGDSDYALTISYLDSGFSGSITPSQVRVHPLTTAYATVQITAPAYAPTGDHWFVIRATAVQSGLHSTEWGNYYVVRPPTTPGHLTATVAGRSPSTVQLSWTASTSPSPYAAIRYVVTRNGTVIRNQSGLSCTDGAPGSGPITYEVRAIDAYGQTSGTVSASVDIPWRGYNIEQVPGP